MARKTRNAGETGVAAIRSWCDATRGTGRSPSCPEDGQRAARRVPKRLAGQMSEDTPRPPQETAREYASTGIAARRCGVRTPWRVPGRPLELNEPRFAPGRDRGRGARSPRDAPITNLASAVVARDGTAFWQTRGHKAATWTWRWRCARSSCWQSDRRGPRRSSLTGEVRTGLSPGRGRGATIDPLDCRPVRRGRPAKGGVEQRCRPAGRRSSRWGSDPRGRGSLAGIRMEECQWTWKRNAKSWGSVGSRRRPRS